MADTKKKLRVIIVGGSVAGLTLAHGLHHNDIDFVVLEASEEMAPHIGASIVVLPNGLRILDQLGICDDIIKMVDPLKNGLTWTGDGKLVVDSDAPVLSRVRMGYPLAFLLRSDLLKVMSNHIPDKSKIITNKRVAGIDHSANGVTVHCKDGSEFSGDIVVGADGIHSVVRKYMQQHIDSKSPGSAKKDKDGIFSEYNCIFGYGGSTDEQLTTGDSHRSYAKDRSTLTFVGEGKLFWFLFSKLDKRYYGEDIPRYTQADCEEHVKGFFDIHMTGNVRVKEVWEKKTFVNMLSLEEMQLDHWTSDRFVLLGDAAHKMTPNLGAGGNAAIESAAALTNSIAKLNDANPSMSGIKTALNEYYQKRSLRANAICDAANQLTRIEALATLPDKLMALHVIPALGDFLSDVTCDTIVGAETLDCLPIPARSLTATMPYNPEFGVGKQEKKWLRALYALPLLVVYYGCHRTMGEVVHQAFPALTEAFQKNGGFEVGAGQIAPVLARYTGFAGFDSVMRVFVGCFTPSIGGLDPAARTQGILFLADLIPLQAIWMIEGVRRGNFTTAAHLLPTIMGIIYQLKGIGFVAPIYFFLHYVQSPLENYAAADNRMTQIGPVKTIIPTIILSYILPSIAMFTWPGLANRQWINGLLWQPFPIYAALIQRILASTVKDTTQEDRKFKPEADMPHLRRTYAFAGGAAALTYLFVRLTSSVSITEAIFSGIRNPSASGNFVKDITKVLRYDQIACFSAGAIWTMLSFGDLKRKNKIQASWAKIVGIFAGTTLIAGPGAAMAAMWSWREECLPPKRNPVAAEKE